MGECSLAGGRRSCNQDKFHIRITRNPLRNICNLLLLIRLLNQDHIQRITLGNLIIERAHGLNPLHISPDRRLLQYLEQLVCRTEWAQLPRRLFHRRLKHKAFIIKVQFKIFQISGAGHHISIIVIFKLIQTVNIHLRYSAVCKQLLLVIHAVAAE